MHNHGSIGLLGSWIFGGKFGFCRSGFSPFCFLFSLVRCVTRADTKIWIVTKQVIASRIPQVLTKLLLLFLSCFAFDNSAHCLDIVWSKETLFFLFYFLLLYFNL